MGDCPSSVQGGEEVGSSGAVQGQQRDPHGAVPLQGWTVAQSHTAGWQGLVSAAGLCLRASGTLWTRAPMHFNSAGVASYPQTAVF